MSDDTRPITVDWDGLADAFTTRDPKLGITAYFDAQTGQTLLRTVEQDEEADDFDPWDPRYHEVPALGSAKGWQLMSGFAEAQGGALGERLAQALEGKGAFRRFRNAVYHAGVSERWLAYEHAGLCEHAAEWLKSQGVEASNPPPTRESSAVDPRTEALEEMGHVLNDAGATLLETAGGLREGSLDDCDEELAELRETLAQLTARVDELLS